MKQSIGGGILAAAFLAIRTVSKS